MALEQDLALLAPYIDKIPQEHREAIANALAVIQHDRNRELARESFLVFVKRCWPQFIEGNHHRIMADAFQRIADGKLKRLMISMPPRSALEVNTLIPTPSGFRKISEIKVGEYVFGPDGQKTRVLGKSRIFKNRPIWRVESDDGAFVEADAEHQWAVSLCRKRRDVTTVHSTEWLWERQFRIGDKRKPALARYKPVEYGEKLLPVGPYTLGVWLGDGSKYDSTFSCHDADQPYVRACISAEGYTVVDRKDPMTCGVNNLKVHLRDSLGVLQNKHIPEVYLMSSVNQRLALLRGLMDTDGSVSKSGFCHFDNTNKRLFDDFVILVRSLGIKVQISSHMSKLYGEECGFVYRASFRTELPAVGLPRKRERMLPYKRPVQRYISISQAGFADTICLTVDRPDGLFLCGKGFLVTHNSKSELTSYLFPAWFLGKFPDKKLIQATHTAELSVGFGRKLRNLMADSGVYRDIFPGMGLAPDSKAAGRWETNRGGEFYAVGVGGAITGRGADLLVIDDPIAGDQIGSDPLPEDFDRVYDWYQSGPRQRLQPGAAMALIMCVARGERVFTCDNGPVPIEEICPGDFVWAFEGDKPVRRRVLASRSQGPDDLIEVVSGDRSLKVNKRHPFLTVSGGWQSREWYLEWKVAGDLIPGDMLVGLKSLPSGNYHRPMAFGDYWRFQSVESVNPAGRGEVYDLTVEGSENFIANGLVVHNTRWSESDLCGRILKAAKQREGSDQWEVINIPALDDKEESYWPDFWSTKELLATRSEIAAHRWAAQYMQAPSSQGGSLIRAEYIKWWTREPPKIDYMIMSIDPAHTVSSRADYSAITVWGVFSTFDEQSQRDKQQVILLDAMNERLEFPRLKQKALEIYKYWNPDVTVVEAKASGLPLAQEFRSIGVPLQTYTPSRGNDKVARVNSVVDLFASGLVWVPRQRWGEQVVDQLVAFPYGEHDDLLDASVMALMHFRSSSLIRLPTDWEDKEERQFVRRREFY